MTMTSGGWRLAIARRAGGVGPRGRAGAGQGCMATGQRHVGASAQELYTVAAASESATSTGPAMVAPECQPKVQLQASFTHLSMCTADGWCECDYRNEGLGTARSGGASTLTGSRQVEPRGKTMGTAIDSEPTAIDLFKELHCSKTKCFSEPVKKAIENYRHCINDDVLWWSQKLVSDPPSVMITISSLWAVSDRKQAVIVIM
uniref:Uncharacterized protein n=1 Tax=Oryza rufipogon TaxID=4529 RepID=A0A0E0R6I5_ORYRU